MGEVGGVVEELVVFYILEIIDKFVIVYIVGICVLIN